jgi:hypothetical protein
MLGESSGSAAASSRKAPPAGDQQFPRCQGGLGSVLPKLGQFDLGSGTGRRKEQGRHARAIDERLDQPRLADRPPASDQQATPWPIASTGDLCGWSLRIRSSRSRPTKRVTVTSAGPRVLLTLMLLTSMLVLSGQGVRSVRSSPGAPWVGQGVSGCRASWPAHGVSVGGRVRDAAWWRSWCARGRGGWLRSGRRVPWPARRRGWPHSLDRRRTSSRCDPLPTRSAAAERPIPRRHHPRISVLLVPVGTE